MSSRYCIFLLFLCSFSIIAAKEQNESRQTTQALSLGVGHIRQLDTYLSPMQYQGKQFVFQREAIRMTRLCAGRVSYQNFLTGSLAFTENPAGNANMWGATIAFHGGWHRHWKPFTHFSLMVGTLLGGQLGALYNTRNGNNPVQARVGADVRVSMAGIYSHRLGRRRLTWRYQADVPLIGCMFSPHYGESYYEIYTNGLNKNILFTNPANVWGIRNLLTVDIPIKYSFLRLGYMGNVSCSKLHGIRMNENSNSFLIGIVRRFSIIHSAKTNSLNHSFL